MHNKESLLKESNFIRDQNFLKSFFNGIREEESVRLGAHAFALTRRRCLRVRMRFGVFSILLVV